MAGTLHRLDWLFALGVIFFCVSIWSLGANDVANSYATSVSSRALTLPQAGCLAVITEFVGAIALGQKVTDTIRNGVFSIDNFENPSEPGVLLLAMVCAELGSATWQTACTRMGFPVSTTQSLVGALVGVGIAADVQVNWGWQSGSVSQIAASWGIAPTIAACFGAIIMMSIKVLVHSRPDPLKWGLRVITFYYALTAGILALFITISGGHGIPTPEELGAGKACGIVLGVFFGVWILTSIFFLPYYYRKLVREDRRIRFWHIPMGPLLWRDNYTLYYPGNPESRVVPDYYDSTYKGDDKENTKLTDEKQTSHSNESPSQSVVATEQEGLENVNNARTVDSTIQTGRQNDLKAIDSLPWAHPKRIFYTIRFVVFHGITRDVVGHQNKGLDEIHQRAPHYDNKVEHLWTTAQVLSAMIMSISHGANDVSNAIGPFTTEYITWKTGLVMEESGTPTWIKAVGGIGLGVGFWTFGYHIMRNLGNRITKHSPTRGFSMELGAAITVLFASQLGLPVSTTQCITGAIVGVAITNGDVKSLNWKQIGKIFIGWVLTVPCAGLVGGLAMAIALNTPSWGPGH